jgi:hypothetical protein
MMGRFVFLPWGTADFTVKAAIKKDSPEAVFLIYEISSFRL